MGEEYRRGWHPEVVAPAGGFAKDKVLVVGAGPAGLECALTLGRRGYEVALCEAGRELGGRVASESRLPGLGAYGRVRDWRVGQIAKLTNIEVFRESRLDSAEILGLGYSHVVIATGAAWRRDGIGRSAHAAVTGTDAGNVLTPDDIMAGRALEGTVLIYDDDQYYMAGVLAEKLLAMGHRVILATPGYEVSSWTTFTDEQFRVQKNLIAMGAELVLTHVLRAWRTSRAEFTCLYTGLPREVAADNLVLVTQRQPRDDLYRELARDEGALAAAGISTLARIGDCEAPGAIVHATYSGHKFAREFGEPIDADAFPYRRELVFVK
jgi:dimethylamine/trimethylamine dehydrogenase